MDKGHKAAENQLIRLPYLMSTYHQLFQSIEQSPYLSTFRACLFRLFQVQSSEHQSEQQRENPRCLRILLQKEVRTAWTC